MGYIDGIHGAPYIAAPLGSVMGVDASPSPTHGLQAMNDSSEVPTGAVFWGTVKLELPTGVEHVAIFFRNDVNGETSVCMEQNGIGDVLS